MPVYLMTAHAYRSWRENDAAGYVQRDEGLKSPSEAIALHRAGISKHDEARFHQVHQLIIHDAAIEVAKLSEVRLHAVAACPTHAHVVYSFRNPACTCGASKYCGRSCEARAFADSVFTRMKRKMGQQIALREKTNGRRWLSRGWDATPVRGQRHLDHLLAIYLPKHEISEAGMFRKYS